MSSHRPVTSPPPATAVDRRPGASSGELAGTAGGAPGSAGAPAVVVVTHDTAPEVLGCLAALGVDVDAALGVDVDAALGAVARTVAEVGHGAGAEPASRDLGPAGTDDGVAHTAPDGRGPGEIVVADAGSRDGTQQLVRRIARSDPRVRLLPLANAGFGRCANAGIRATSAPVVVVMNADVRARPAALAALASGLAEHPQAGAIGPLVRYPGGRIQASARRIPDPATALLHALLGRLRPDNPATRRYHDRPTLAAVQGPRLVGWLSGCVVALRREAVEQVGGFDPGYFLYVEDLDLSVRLHAAGWQVLQDPRIEVVHRVGASTQVARARALAWHAASLQRYLLGRIDPRWRAVARVPVAIAVRAWAAVTWASERRRWSAGRSSTGEAR